VTPSALKAAVETITDASRDPRLLPSRLDDLTDGRHNDLLPPVDGQDPGMQLQRHPELGLEL
jgi:hypothetical protein